MSDIIIFILKQLKNCQHFVVFGQNRYRYQGSIIRIGKPETEIADRELVSILVSEKNEIAYGYNRMTSTKYNEILWLKCYKFFLLEHAGFCRRTFPAGRRTSSP